MSSREQVGVTQPPGQEVALNPTLLLPNDKQCLGGREGDHYLQLVNSKLWAGADLSLRPHPF